MKDEGQYAKGIKQTEPTFFIKGNGAIMALTARRWIWYYTGDSLENRRFTSSMTFLGANPNAKIEDEGIGEYFERHYTVHDDGRPIYSVRKLRVCGLYPGIDLEMFAGEAGLRYEFLVQPGADVSKIQMEFSSDLSLSINSDGIYLAKSTLISITDETPYIVMPDGSKLACRFEKRGSFIGLSFDRRTEKLLAQANQPLRIDPQIVWSTYYRGIAADQIMSVSIDSSRNVLALGQTFSTSDIASPGSHQSTFGGGISDAFLVKFDRCGRRLWATYYGGNGGENAGKVSSDLLDNIYISGTTNSTSNISTPGSHQQNFGGMRDGFLVKFNKNGVRLWGTYYGGTNIEGSAVIAVNHTGTRVLLVGATQSATNISTPGSFKPVYSGTGSDDGYFVMFDSSGTRLFGSYFGGTAADEITSASFDALGNFYIVGFTSSASEIASPNAYDGSYAGMQPDGFFAKFTSTGARIYSSYYGGNLLDRIQDVAVRNNLMYFCGVTESPTSISTPGSFQPNISAAGVQNGFLVQFDTNGTTRNWGTYYGAQTILNGVTTDLSGNVFFVGTTSGTNLATPGAFSTTLSGISDLIVGRFATNGTRTWASYYGGPQQEGSISSIVFGFNNTILIAGTTNGIHNVLGIFGFYNNSQGSQSGVIARFFATPLHLEVRAVSKINLCPEESFTVAFIGGGFGTPTTVFAEISDTNYSFISPITVGQIGSYSTGASTITCSLPKTLNAGKYLVRIRSQSPAFNSVHFCDTLTLLANGIMQLQKTKDTLCDGDSDTLRISNYTSGAITWFQNGAQISGANQPKLFVSQPGVYRATVNVNGCIINTDTVTLYQGGNVNITWTSFPVVCVNSPPFALTQASPSGGTYSGPGVSNNEFNPAVAGVGKHPIKYTINSTLGNCPTVSYDTLEVFPTYSQTLTGSICQGETITLPDGQVVSQAGTYTVNLKTINNCDSTLIYIISALPPTGDLLPPDTNLCEGQTITLNPGFFQSYQWNTGDTTPTITVSERGLYKVTVRDALGCIYTDSILVTNNCSPVVFVPNAFSPNDDRRNDRFKVAVSQFITYFELMIFNRWGELVFQTFTADFEWDGTYQGQKLPQGNYPYRIIYEYEIGGNRYRKQEYGSINIVR
ncbi:MAG: gliding motility-associated C-terminal domain-containing protein [Thermaurantimonas sp.]|uniref:DUF7948 domain-containing protein n=1 Tax=Thermaurantimonas sp. TaxID=2681568 RepID=UPI0039195C99